MYNTCTREQKCAQGRNTKIRRILLAKEKLNNRKIQDFFQIHQEEEENCDTFFTNLRTAATTICEQRLNLVNKKTV